MIRDRSRLEALLADVRTWVRDVAVPNEDRVEELDEVPADIVADMKRRGYFGWSIPEEYGGAGLTAEELVLAAMELSQCSAAFRARVGTNTGIGSEALVVDGTAEQKARYLPKLASGEFVGCFALTEPEAGSDATALRTTATRDGSSYVLNGKKCFITNAPMSSPFWPARTRTRREREASAPSSSSAERRGSASASRTGRWGRQDRPSPRFTSTNAGCRRTA